MRIHLLFLLILPVLTSTARASCVRTLPKLSWSYPAQDATGVPTNTHLFLPSALRVVREDGVPARAITAAGVSNARFDPGPLAPDTDYRFRVTVRGTDALSLQDVEREEILHFRTGLGPDSSVASLVTIEASETRVVGHDWSPPTDACAQITPGCFDTLEDTQVSFNVALSPQPVVWIVSQSEPAANGDLEGYAYPGACGAPWLFVHRTDSPHCVRIHGIAANGAISSSDRYCAKSTRDEAPTPPSTTIGVPPDAGTSAHRDAATDVEESVQAASDDGGCSVAAASGRARSCAGLGALVLAMLTAVGARRRT